MSQNGRQPWLFSTNCSREHAVALLSRCEVPNGLFLVRDSSSNPGAWGISCCHGGYVYHYLVRGSASGQYIMERHRQPECIPGSYSCLDEVITFLHQTHDGNEHGFLWEHSLVNILIASKLDQDLMWMTPREITVRSDMFNFVQISPFRSLGVSIYDDPETIQTNSFSIDQLGSLSKKELVHLVRALRGYVTPDTFMQELCQVHDTVYVLKSQAKDASIYEDPKKQRKQDIYQHHSFEDGKDSEWEIPPSELKYTQTEPIGSGSFGVVYKGDWHGPVAIKKLKVREPDKHDIEAFRNEVTILRKTRHRNVLLFMGACTRGDVKAIVCEWCEGLSLYEQIHTKQAQFSDKHKLEMATQIAQGMDYLHSKQIVHRDLKSPNILLRKAYRQEDRKFSAPELQVADFGLATVKTKFNIETLKNSSELKGSVIWMAPEIITQSQKRGENPYSNASDVYAFGIILFELLSSKLPYEDKRQEQIILGVGSGSLCPDFTQLYVDGMRDICAVVDLCLRRIPEERPSFALCVLQIGAVMHKKAVLYDITSMGVKAKLLTPD